MPIKTLMVDVDGVIVVHSQPGGWSANLGRDLGLESGLLQERFFQPHFADIVHGRAPLRDRLTTVLAEIAPHITADELIEYWFSHDATLNHALLEELAEMRSQGLALHLATVQEHERARYLWETLRLCDHFDTMHYAADLGHAKPAAEFYRAIEARTDLRGDEIFFIDDNAGNVEGAIACGWHAALWTGSERLASLMVDAGL